MDPSGIADRMRQIQETIAAAVVEVVSDDHAVTVTVGPGGAVHDLRFSPRAFRYSGAELGELVVRTVREGHTRMGQELAAALADLTAGIRSGAFTRCPAGRVRATSRQTGRPMIGSLRFHGSARPDLFSDRAGRN